MREPASEPGVGGYSARGHSVSAQESRVSGSGGDSLRREEHPTGEAPSAARLFPCLILLLSLDPFLTPSDSLG